MLLSEIFPEKFDCKLIDATIYNVLNDITILGEFYNYRGTWCSDTVDEITGEVIYIELPQQVGKPELRQLVLDELNYRLIQSLK